MRSEIFYNLSKYINKNRQALGLLYVLFTSSLLLFLFYNHFYDDPFITYRYAHNLARGRGFVFNPGLRVQSTSTPLFALILAGIYPFWSDIPHTAVIIGAVSLSLGALFLWVLAQNFGTPLVGWLGIFLYPSYPLLLLTLGSEIPLYLVFCLGAFTFYNREEYTQTAVFCALAVLTRPDGVIIPTILGLHYLLKFKGQFQWKPALIFLGLTLPWFLFAWVYYGTPIPATLFAKQQQGGMEISQRFAPGLVTVFKPYFKHWYFWLQSILALFGIGYLAVRARQWLLFFVWIFSYFLAFSVSGISRYYWYYAPLVLGFIVLIGLGISAVRNLILGDQIHFQNGNSNRRLLSRAVTVGITMALFIGSISGLLRLAKWNDPRHPIYKEVGEWINNNTSASASLGTLEVGIIGYYADRLLIGFAGLIQPEVANQLNPQSTYEDSALWAVEHYHPDYLVLQSGVFPSLEEGYINRYCRYIKGFSGGYSNDIDIYSCINH